MNDGTPAHDPERFGEAESSRLLELGPQLLVRFAALLRTARTHDVTNQAFRRQLQDFLETLQQAMEEEDEVALAAVADYFYLNGVRLRASAATLTTYHSLLSEFERRAVGGVRFLHGVSPAEMERFLQLFMAAEDPTLAGVPVRGGRGGQHRARPARPRRGPREGGPQPGAGCETRSGRASAAAPRRCSGARCSAPRASCCARAQTGRPDLRQAKRLVQPVVDSIMKHEYSIVGLTALKDHDEYTYAHCVNVSVLSVSMGQALGLPRQALADLGVAGLLHDIGKVAVPGDVLRKPARLTADEWSFMQRHPLEGVKMMFRMPGPRPTWRSTPCGSASSTT